MPTISIDLVEGADFQIGQQNNSATGSGTRVAFVKGLASGDPDQTATALSRAVAAVLAAYPMGTAYDSGRFPGVVLIGTRAEGIRQQDRACIVRLLYGVPTANQGSSGGSVLSVRDNTSIVESRTQIDPASGTVLKVRWTDAHGNKFQDIVTISYPETLRSLTMEMYILASSMSTYRAAVRKANNATWAGSPVGYWRISRFYDERPTYDKAGLKAYLVTVEAQSRVDRDWASYEFLRDSNNGKFLPVADADIAILRAATYIYGKTNRNGVIKVGPYALADYSSLFGFTSIP